MTIFSLFLIQAWYKIEHFSGWTSFQANYFDHKLLNMKCQAYQNAAKKLIYLDLKDALFLNYLIFFINLKNSKRKLEQFHFQNYLFLSTVLHRIFDSFFRTIITRIKCFSFIFK